MAESILNEQEAIMSWEAPSFVEIKMDAEINAYQDDFADVPDVQAPSPVMAVAGDSQPQG